MFKEIVLQVTKTDGAKALIGLIQEQERRGAVFRL
jgi:hypothetical protein